MQTACEKAVLNWHRVSASDQPVVYVKAIMANARISSWRKHRRESLVAELPEVSVTDEYSTEDAGVWAAVAALPVKSHIGRKSAHWRPRRLCQADHGQRQDQQLAARPERTFTK